MSSESSDNEVVFNYRNMYVQESEYETRSEASVFFSAPSSRHRRRQRATPVLRESSDSESDAAPMSRRSRNLNINNARGDGNRHSRVEHVPHIRPEPYSGEEPWESFISHFKDCAKLGGRSARSCVLFLASSLRGKARQYYMKLDEHERRDYRTLARRMKKYMGLLKNRQRMPDESIISLCDDNRQLTKKAHSQMNTKSQDIVALNQLYKIISPDMKCRCIDNNCSSIHEAVAVIDKYESILCHCQPQSNRVRAVETNGVDRKLADLIKGLDSRLKRLESVNLARSTGTQQQQPRSTGEPRRCFKCRSDVHFFRDCPQRRHQPSDDRNQSAPVDVIQ